MQADMCIYFARLDSTAQASAKAICDRLDAINEILSNPLLTKSRELYRMAQPNYNKGFFEEALKDLQEAVKYHKTDYFSWLLIGMTYLFGKNEDCNVIDLDASIDALKKAARYIRPDAKDHDEARKMAAEIYFHLGLAQQIKAMDARHAKRAYKSYLEAASDSFMQSWNYSREMPEARYNRARCNVLLGDVNEAMHDLGTAIVKNPSYCLKAATESDFSSVKEEIQKLLSDIKTKVYPEAKAYFDRIPAKRARFPGSYSPELTKLMNKRLPTRFTADLPPFDVLEGRVFFPRILKQLEKEWLHIFDICIEGDNTILRDFNEPDDFNGSLDIPNDITSIGDKAFLCCENLSTITIPPSVTSIGDNAFKGCKNLNTITIPPSVTSIGDKAFLGCENLSTITIPPSVTSIGDKAFFGCENLNTITIPPSVTSIGDEAFFGCENLNTITIPPSVTSIGDGAFWGCKNLNTITIPPLVTSIGDKAFWGCENLNTITIPPSVTSIGENAFINCYSLTTIMVNNENQHYASEEGILYNKAKTRFIHIPRSISGSVTIPAGVTSIGQGAFRNRDVTAVTIPASVTSIREEAFYECTSLTSVTFTKWSIITGANFDNHAFPEGIGLGGNNLRAAYLSGGAGTYTRTKGGDIWTKQ